MSSAIYTIHENGELVEMTQQRYDSEVLLQRLLAKYPSLLASDQIDTSEPRRWILISREVGVPAEEGGAGLWSLDHLFLDQDAIPTLVEVKRSTDARLRREVVGQMLDYAANGVAYWPAESLRAQFEARRQRHDLDPEQELARVLGDDADQEQFWQQAKTNLQAGRLRLVFVADRIPAALQQIIEFLNRQMDPAEVLAIEIRQFVGQGLKTLVPRVIGKKLPPPGPRPRQWDEPSFFQELLTKVGTGEANVARRLLTWARSRSRDGLQVSWDTNRQFGHFYLTVNVNGLRQPLLRVSTSGNFRMWLDSTIGPLQDEAKRQQLADRLSTILGVHLSADALRKSDQIPLLRLQDDGAIEQFLGTLDWILEEARAG